MKMEHRWRRRARWLLLGIALGLVGLIADYILYPMIAVTRVHDGNRAENGLWLRYTWYFGEWQSSDMERLVARVNAGEIRDVYCHVRYIEPDGTLRYRQLRAARRFTQTLHVLAPDVRVFAWIYAGNARGTPSVPITETGIRSQMAEEARWLVEECGFDGIQWDYEITTSNEPGLRELLRDTRAALPAGTPLSVCTPMWYPFPFTSQYGWSEAYFRDMAAECDQLVVMGYDSAIYLPRGYVWLMRKQAEVVTRAAAAGNPDCRVLIGVPNYTEGGLSHHPRAENLPMAIKGVQEGLHHRRAAPEVFAGIALFADYTTSEDEWALYRRQWLEAE